MIQNHVERPKEGVLRCLLAFAAWEAVARHKSAYERKDDPSIGGKCLVEAPGFELNQ
jgi:hypothetical protein